MTTTDQVFCNVPLKLEITRKRMCDLICTCIEGGNSSWFQGIGAYILPDGITKQDFVEGGPQAFEDWPPLYSAMTQENCKVSLIVEETVREDRYSYTIEIGPEELKRGLELMANNLEYRRHFLDFIEGNEDCITADIFMQFVVYEEVVYC